VRGLKQLRRASDIAAMRGATVQERFGPRGA